MTCQSRSEKRLEPDRVGTKLRTLSECEGHMGELDRGLYRELVDLLVTHPPFEVADERDAWLLNLPRGFRISNVKRRNANCKTDLEFIVDQTCVELRSGEWALLILLHVLIKDTNGLQFAQTLSELCQRIEAGLLRSENRSQDPADYRRNWLEQIKLFPDPFAYTDGGTDPYMSEYFCFAGIQDFRQIYRRIEQPEAVFIFGADGSGKSSVRNVIENRCWDRGVLPVLYQQFSPLIGRLQRGQSVEPVDHLMQAIKLTLRTLLKDMERHVARRPQINEDNRVIRNTLWSYVMKCEDDAEQRRVLGAHIMPDPNPLEQLPQDEHEFLGVFSRYVIALFGYRGICFLVDPEADITPDVGLAWKVLQPLLSAYHLVELPESETAFKFFLNEKFRDLALKVPWIKQQTARKVYSLIWRPETLRGLLEDRLVNCSGKSPAYHSLEELTDGVSRLDDELIRYAGGKPRELIALCDRLFNCHCQQPITPERLLITRSEVDDVLREFLELQSDPELSRLVAGGEGPLLEFKSTMRYNLKAGKPDDEMKREIARTICGFMNAEGGTLIVGIDDNRQVVGLDHDFGTLGKKNQEGFELAFNDLVATYLALPTRQGLSVRFADYQGKQVCLVVIERSLEPVYCCFDHNQEFYIRVGPSTRLLMLKEAVGYIVKRFRGWVDTLPVEDLVS